MQPGLAFGNRDNRILMLDEDNPLLEDDESVYTHVEEEDDDLRYDDDVVDHELEDEPDPNGPPMEWDQDAVGNQENQGVDDPAGGFDDGDGEMEPVEQGIMEEPMEVEAGNVEELMDGEMEQDNNDNNDIAVAKEEVQNNNYEEAIDMPDNEEMEIVFEPANDDGDTENDNENPNEGDNNNQ